MELTVVEDAAPLAELRQRLEDERGALVARLAADDPEQYEPSATHGHGETELAVLDGQRRIDAALESEARATIAELDAALARIDDGTYGTCVSCGHAIAPERLSAIPQAARCVTCQQQLQRED